MASTICKFRCESCEPQYESDKGRKVVLSTHYDESICNEDAGFSKATPSGRIEVRIDNPSALESMKFTPGNYYYVTIHTDR